MKHFKMQEFVSSPTADSRGIDNKPNGEVMDNLERLVDNVLDPLREALRMPIYVNSGYRSEALNRAVGGVVGSQHTKGEAADVTTGSHDGNVNLYRTLKRLRLPVDQAINERNYAWIHISHRASGNRGMYLAK